MILQQFDFLGNLTQKVSTKLAVSSYGEDELISLIQTYAFAPFRYYQLICFWHQNFLPFWIIIDINYHIFHLFFGLFSLVYYTLLINTIVKVIYKSQLLNIWEKSSIKVKFKLSFVLTQLNNTLYLQQRSRFIGLHFIKTNLRLKYVDCWVSSKFKR